MTFSGLCLALAALFLNTAAYPGEPAESFQPVTVALHAHSRYSDNGVLSLEQLAERARTSGVRVVITADHDRQQCAYGIGPLRRWLNKSYRARSVTAAGARAYFSHIERVNEKHPDVLLIGGVETTPLYWWEGSLFKKDLTLRDWHKHMVITGLPTPEAYECLPLVGNGSRFDQYHGSQGEKPYQAIIDYVNRHAPETGIVFWAHPEAPDYARPVRHGRIFLHTSPYAASLRGTHDYTGFSLFQEGNKTVGTVGGLWDQMLTDYCRGARDKPVWAAAELDFRDDGYLNTWMDSFTNTLMLDMRERVTPSTVFRALRAGRFYCTATPRGRAPIVLDSYALRRGHLSLRVRTRDNSRTAVTVTLIREGTVIAERTAQTPASVRFPAPPRADRKTWYRVVITTPERGAIITNPLFADPSASTGAASLAAIPVRVSVE